MTEQKSINGTYSLYDNNGYLQSHSVEVAEQDDGAIRVGGSLYRADELYVERDDDGELDRITHTGGGGYLIPD